MGCQDAKSRKKWKILDLGQIKAQLSNIHIKINSFIADILLLHHNTIFITYSMAASAQPSSTGSTKLDGLVQKASANTPEKLSGIALYSRFALAGAICCSVTHGGLTPVDV